MSLYRRLSSARDPAESPEIAEVVILAILTLMATLA
jgi:hypothetical protein